MIKSYTTNGIENLITLFSKIQENSELMVIVTGHDNGTVRHFRAFGIKAFSINNDFQSASELIETYYSENVNIKEREIKLKPVDYAPKLTDLIIRLDDATDAICDLRINSAADVVDELRSISSDLKLKLKRPEGNKAVSKSDLTDNVVRILKAIANFYDHISNDRLAAIVVSGATTALMGCSGFSAALSLTVMLASWNGKDTFMAAINKIGLPKIEAKS